MLLIKLLLGGVLLGSPLLIRAEVLLTDRIGLAEDAQMTQPRRWGLEVGLNAAWTGSDLASSSTLGVPSLLLRGALAAGAELRLATEYRLARHLNKTSPYQEESSGGINYLSLGAKLSLLKEGRVIPQTAFIGMLGLNESPGENAAGGGSLLSFRLLSDKSFGEKITLSLNAGLCKTGSNAGWEGDTTVTLGYQATKKVECFAEIWNNWYAGYHQLGTHLGVFTQPLPRIRLELLGGLGYDGSTPQLILSGGLAIRTH